MPRLCSRPSPDIFSGSDAEGFARIRTEAKLVRYGADCYAYGLCALGFVDAVVESGLKPYDFCALIPIIEGAGGIVTDWQGRKPGLVTDGPHPGLRRRNGLHEQLLARLAAP